MLKEVQKKLQKEEQKKAKELKNIIIDLDACIEEAKKTQIGEFIKVNSSLFEVKVKFKSKYISKPEYSQLLGLQKYMIENPKYVESDLRRAIYSKPIKYGFIIECDRKCDDFFVELGRHGATSIAENIAREKGSMEDWAKKHI